MPYFIHKRDGEYCVIKIDDGKNMGCHPTRAQAAEQIAAIYASEHGKSDEGALSFKCVPFAIKAASEDGMFEGIAGAYNNIDAYGEIIHPAAFDQDLAGFLNDGFIGGLNHDWDHPIGRPIEAKTTGEGLVVKGKLSDTPHGRECRTLMKDGVVRKLSIGYKAMGRQTLESLEECLALDMRNTG